jgi:hypothetical protein
VRGNSAATFFLAASVTGLALMVARQWIAVLLAAVTAASGIVLLVLSDLHGAAMIGGLVAGLLVSAVSPPAGIVTPAAQGRLAPGR